MIKRAVGLGLSETFGARHLGEPAGGRAEGWKSFVRTLDSLAFSAQEEVEVLLDDWPATKSSPRLSAWLENHRLFGPILCNWRNGKIIARRAKVSATVSMLFCAGLMLVMLDHSWPIYLAIAGMSLGNLWI